jgi:arylsulfatase A-like enzyme
MNSARLLAFLLFAAVSVSAAEKPNIIVILADDYGYGSSTCYGADGKLVQTPNIDRLAREGRRFTDANTTSSVCSPTRYSVLTGRYCWRTSLTHEVLSTFAPLHIEPGRLNMASLLKKQGYQTAAIGKWHLGYGTENGRPNWRADFTAELSPGPLDLGFDYHFGVPGNHGDVTGVYVENRFVYGLRSGKIPEGMKIAGPVPDDDHYKATYTAEDTESKKGNIIPIDAPRRVNERVMPNLTDKAVNWISQQKSGTPFFLYFTPVAVHNPVTPDKDLVGSSKAGPYGDWIHELDRSVGRVLDTLDKQGVAKDTLVIFTSDNGGVKEPNRADSVQTQALNAGLAVNGPWRGGKHHVFEGGFRVNFIVRWPGHAPAGTTCDEMISLADILATTSAIVGEPLPDAGKAAEDSYNILPAILGESYAEPLRRDMIVHSSDGVFAVRKGPWKWIEGVPVEELKAGARKAHADEFHPQLYNLKDDPGETKDLLKEQPEVAKEMAALLERYRDGGYSREMPPVTEKKKPQVAVLAPLEGAKVMEAALNEVPGKPWKVTGTWTAKDGAVWGTAKANVKQPAALQASLPISDGTLQYDLNFGDADRHSLRISTAGNKRSFRIVVSPGSIEIAKNPEPGEGQDKVVPLARVPLKLKRGAWHTLRLAFQGDTVTAQIGGVTAKGTHEIIRGSKDVMNILVFEGAMGFRNLSVVK